MLSFRGAVLGLFPFSEPSFGIIPNKYASLERVLTMVYNTQNYWLFGLCPLSGILKTKKQHFGNWI
jgi:hypothetical protein